MSWDRRYYVYMMTSNKRDVLYIGVTNSLERRVWQHHHPEQPGFASRYHCIHLVYYEIFDDVRNAIARETQLKGWRRAKKEALIARMNPEWRDLASEFLEDHSQ